MYTFSLFFCFIFGQIDKSIFICCNFLKKMLFLYILYRILLYILFIFSVFFISFYFIIYFNFFLIHMNLDLGESVLIEPISKEIIPEVMVSDDVSVVYEEAEHLTSFDEDIINKHFSYDIKSGYSLYNLLSNSKEFILHFNNLSFKIELSYSENNECYIDKV